MTSPLSSQQLAAATSGILTTLVLYKLSYRGDTLLLSHAAAWVAVFFLLSQNSAWYENLASATMLLTIHVGTMISLTCAYRVSPLHPLWRFRGPIANKLTSLVLLKMVAQGKRFEVIKRLHDTYGTFVRTGPNTLSINTHAALHPIYATAQSMDKSAAYRQGRAPEGGLFFIREREAHNQRRRVWGSAFFGGALEHLMKVVEKRTAQMVGVVKERGERAEGGTVDMTEVIRYWSFDLMGEMTFGSSSRIELMEEGDPGHIVENVQNGTAAFEIFGEVPALFDILWNLPAAKDLRILEKLSASFVQTRKQKYQGDDIASHLLGEHGGPTLTDPQLTLDATLAISAGSDTTAGTLTFMLFHLLSTKHVYATLLDELTSAFASAEDVTSDAAKTLQGMPYLSGVVHEALRLGTPFGGMPRVVGGAGGGGGGGQVIAGEYVPAGTIVGVPLSTMQLSEENYYPNPEKFLPERWQPGGLGPDTRTAPLMCFSFGAFSCLGKPFALQELHFVLAKLVLAFDMQFADEFDKVKFVSGIRNMRTTIFGYPLLVKVTPRR